MINAALLPDMHAAWDRWQDKMTPAHMEALHALAATYRAAFAARGITLISFYHRGLGIGYC